MLGARNSSQRDEILTKEKHEAFDVYSIDQSFFGLLRQSIRKNSDRILLFKITIGDVEGM